jgi:hypothetical protein
MAEGTEIAPERKIELDDEAYRVAALTGDRVLVVHRRGVSIWDVATGTKVGLLGPFYTSSAEPVLTHDGRVLCGGEESVSLWDPATLEKLAEWSADGDEVTWVGEVARGLFACVAGFGSLYVWPSTGAPAVVPESFGAEGWPYLLGDGRVLMYGKRCWEPIDDARWLLRDEGLLDEDGEPTDAWTVEYWARQAEAYRRVNGRWWYCPMPSAPHDYERAFGAIDRLSGPDADSGPIEFEEDRTLYVFTPLIRDLRAPESPPILVDASGTLLGDAVPLPGGRVVTLSRRGDLGLWDGATGKWLGSGDSGARGSDYHHHSGLVAASSERIVAWHRAVGFGVEIDGAQPTKERGGLLVAFDAALKAVARRFASVGGMVQASPTTLVTWPDPGGNTRALDAWSTDTLDPLGTMHGHESTILGAVALPDGRIVSCDRRALCVWRP